jgi:hypothetical protein
MRKGWMEEWKEWTEGVLCEKLEKEKNLIEKKEGKERERE